LVGEGGEKMNITDVLPLGSTEGRGKAQREDTTAANTLLFSLFLNNLLGKSSAVGQKAEEQPDYKPGPDQENSYTESILGSNAYLPLLQYLFPAGKEANSGLTCRQNLDISQNKEADLKVVLDLWPTDFLKGSSQESLNYLTGIPTEVFGQEQADLLNAALLKAWGQQQMGFLNSLLSEVFGQGQAVPLEAWGEQQIGFLKNLLVKALGQKTAGVSNPESIKNLSEEQIIFLKKELVSTLGKEQPFLTKQNKEPIQPHSNVQVSAQALRGLGLEGSTGPKVRELTALPLTELDDNIETGKQLQELSGKLELANKLERDSGVVLVNRPFYLFTGKEDLSTKSGGESTTLQEQALRQESQGENRSPAQQSDWPTALMGDKVYEAVASEVPLENRISASSHKVKVWEEVLNQLSKQDFNNQKEVRELSIHLQPEELGKVRIFMRLENGQIHLVLNASEQTTGVILENHLQDLKNGLTQMGVNCGSFEMSQEDGYHQETKREYLSSDQDFPYRRQEEEILPALTATTYFTGNGSGNRINVSA
jgi:flagellar hook-length control protein FliK